jgi:TRAP-type C4-dicarboxylate transport system permease large subunit
MSDIIIASTSKFGLSKWQITVILGVALSGFAAYITTYNAVSGIDKQYAECADTGDLGKKMQVQFIVTMILACIAMVVGIILSWLCESMWNSPHRIITFGITIAGIFGLLYALSIKFSSYTNTFKVGMSWTALVAFILLGFLVDGNVFSVRDLSLFLRKIKAEMLWMASDVLFIAVLLWIGVFIEVLTDLVEPSARDKLF